MDKQQVRGRKGGKGASSAASRVAVEDPNTLQSTSYARVVDLISEGPIVGLVNGLQSVYFDKTPLANEDDSTNFSGVTVVSREGYPDQEHIPGFPSAETEVSVSTEIKFGTPVVRSITNPEVDAVRVKIQIPTLSYQDASTGDMHGSSVQVAIDVRAANSSWAIATTDYIQGKTTSTYERQYRVNLSGAAPWDIRVRRLTEDSDQVNLRNQTLWSTYTEIIDAKLSYPDSALIGLEVDAQQFGSSIPERAYQVRGRIISVPSNYDPDSRSYTGLWDGTFKQAWSNNPAWVFYDMATNTRYGAGLSKTDKWSLYEIGRYCDERVPDGQGGTEPRFVLNTVINSQAEAYNVLNTLASAFRGMIYWGANEVVAVQDAPADAVKIVTPASIIEGSLKIVGSSRTARHSVARVTWNDPADFYQSAIEVVEDADLIEQYGYTTTDVTAYGCTTRSQAHRFGRWILYSESAETDSVEYQTGTDHADVRPGDIIKLLSSDCCTCSTR